MKATKAKKIAFEAMCNKLYKAAIEKIKLESKEGNFKTKVELLSAEDKTSFDANRIVRDMLSKKGYLLGSCESRGTTVPLNLNVRWPIEDESNF